MDDEEAPVREKPSFESLRNRYDIRRGGQYSNRPVAEKPRPEIIATPKPLDPRSAGMRLVGVRGNESEGGASAAPLGEAPYKVGERVEHLKFGAGRIERIEPLATDHKLVVVFDDYGTKTLLAKFAKLTKL